MEILGLIFIVLIVLGLLDIHRKKVLVASMMAEAERHHMERAEAFLPQCIDEGSEPFWFGIDSTAEEQEFLSHVRKHLASRGISNPDTFDVDIDFEQLALNCACAMEKAGGGREQQEFFAARVIEHLCKRRGRRN